MEEKLIKLYCEICHQCKYTTVAERMQRLSNNGRPKFTDEECITIYLWGIMNGHFTNKAIWEFIRNYWSSWFPLMPKYKAFNHRLCRLWDVFPALLENICDRINLPNQSPLSLLDSMPIVVAKSARSGFARTAADVCAKGYCASKREYFYGVKLHFLGQRRIGALPKPEGILISKGNEFDLNVAKRWLVNFRNMTLICDKAYIDKQWTEDLRVFQNIELITPVKKEKGQKFLDSADKLLSSAVSSFRQTVESFFSWIQEKTNIQSASKVRSANGLFSHIFGRLIAACLLLV